MAQLWYSCGTVFTTTGSLGQHRAAVMPHIFLMLVVQRNQGLPLAPYFSLSECSLLAKEANLPSSTLYSISEISKTGACLPASSSGGIGVPGSAKEPTDHNSTLKQDFETKSHLNSPLTSQILQWCSGAGLGWTLSHHHVKGKTSWSRCKCAAY